MFKPSVAVVMSKSSWMAPSAGDKLAAGSTDGVIGTPSTTGPAAGGSVPSIKGRKKRRRPCAYEDIVARGKAQLETDAWTQFVQDNFGSVSGPPKKRLNVLVKQWRQLKDRATQVATMNMGSQHSGQDEGMPPNEMLGRTSI